MTPIADAIENALLEIDALLRPVDAAAASKIFDRLTDLRDRVYDLECERMGDDL